jgi:6-phosphogluconolactonase
MNATESPTLRILSNAQAAADECAAYILNALSETLQSRPVASIALSGGSTPKLMFATLAKSGFDWKKVHFFWVDERCVPPSDSQSNFKMTDEAWLTPAKIPQQNIHRIQGELPPAEGAAQYVANIRAFFELADDALPVFDILHRGMGPDAHTASLFPGEPLISNRKDIATNVWVEKMQMHRVTLLPGVLLAARQTILEVAGADKAEALRQVLTGPEDLFRYPCQIASRDEKAIWFLDEAAAAQL